VRFYEWTKEALPEAIETLPGILEVNSPALETLSRSLWFILEMQRVKSSTEELKLDEMWRLTLETGNLLEVHPRTVKPSPGAVSHIISS
jgi:hypothetical protein